MDARIEPIQTAAGERMTEWLHRAGCWAGVALAGLLAASCYSPYYYAAPPVPENAIRFQVGYPKAFDRIVQTLQNDGFEIAAADREHGFIETRPRKLKAAEGANSPFEYQTVVSIRAGGGWNSSWATVNVMLVPSYPKEQERVIEKLEHGVKSPTGGDEGQP